MTDQVTQTACAALFTGLRELFSTLRQAAILPRQGADLGHGDGVDDDARAGTGEAQSATREARSTGGDTTAESTTGTCPTCKVAIVVGHSSTSGGAYSPTIGENEWTYNSDIARRTVAKIAEIGEGEVSAQIFYRTTGGGYTTEMRRAYEPVNAYLEGVPTNKKIAIELHFNSIDGRADYARVLYDRSEGRSDFAQQAADRMGEIYGVSRRLIKHYEDNPTGHCGFNFGPANTFLMEPFFGSDERTSNIAKTEAGRDALAEVYARLLVEWTQ